MRLKISDSYWLVIEMNKPSIFVQKHFKVQQNINANESFESDEWETVKETVKLNVNRANLAEFAKTKLKDWELKTLDLLKFDYQKYSF